MASDRDALRNKKKETPGGGVSLYDQDTTPVLQGGATFIGKVTALYLLFFPFLHASVSRLLSKLASSRSSERQRS